MFQLCFLFSRWNEMVETFPFGVKLKWVETKLTTMTYAQVWIGYLQVWQPKHYAYRKKDKYLPFWGHVAHMWSTHHSLPSNNQQPPNPPQQNKRLIQPVCIIGFNVDASHGLKTAYQRRPNKTNACLID